MKYTTTNNSNHIEVIEPMREVHHHHWHYGPSPYRYQMWPQTDRYTSPPPGYQYCPQGCLIPIVWHGVVPPCPHTEMITVWC